jgi:hypothetical protein
VTKRRKKGAIIQIWSHPCPQGYRCRVEGHPSRALVDYEGIFLAEKKKNKSEENGEPQ